MDQVDQVIVELPNGDERSVTRASLPSTVSRKVMPQAATRPERVVAGPEQRHRREHQHQAERRDLVRRDAGVGAQARRPARRTRPDVERHQVGDALVRAAEDALLDRRQRGLAERDQVRRLALAQGVVVAVGQGRGAHLPGRGRRAAGREQRRRVGGVGGGDIERDRDAVDRVQGQVALGGDQAADQGIVVDPVGAQQDASRRLGFIGSARRRARAGARGAAPRAGPRRAAAIGRRRCPTPAGRGRDGRSPDEAKEAGAAK